jgi:hypothetical protein
MRGLRKEIALKARRLLLALACLAALLPSAGRYVLCTGPDGHSAIENGIGGRCDDARVYRYTDSCASQIDADQCPIGCVDTIEDSAMLSVRRAAPSASAQHPFAAGIARLQAALSRRGWLEPVVSDSPDHVMTLLTTVLLC